MTDAAQIPDEVHPALTAALTDGELQIAGRLTDASNATYLAVLSTALGLIECVYKPIRGERPLWDFPTGTLGLREVAAYEVSCAGGFDVVPVTVLVDGPLGPGSLQAWVDVDAQQTDRLVDLIPTEDLPREGWFDVVDGLDARDRSVSVVHADCAPLRRMAIFDLLVNNADRKGGHILPSSGHVFGVDHGVTFHTEFKLRTLLWGWAGSELTEAELAGVRAVRDQTPDRLFELLAEPEIEAFWERADRLLARGRFPRPRGHRPAIPWPPF
ncbi:MAG: SCO1664 family protein [Microlunatus sp.]|nr:SCO1664 family protein [Microlunatus sp.]MDN5803952.1 SCO1664 family protein [Microlunatus sp.]